MYAPKMKRIARIVDVSWSKHVRAGRAVVIYLETTVLGVDLVGAQHDGGRSRKKTTLAGRALGGLLSLTTIPRSPFPRIRRRPLSDDHCVARAINDIVDGERLVGKE